MIFDSVADVVTDDVFLRLPGLVPGRTVILKLEGLNPSGSIKLKTATGLLDALERDGVVGAGARIIESSSGNLGVALAAVCAARGYELTVVTDPNGARHAIRVMETLGAAVVRVTARDTRGGYLNTRIDYIRRRMAEDAGLVWPNQYANPANRATHRERTARALLDGLREVDALFVGAGTTGTLMGCVEYFARHSPHTRIVAVDTTGSVTFGGPAMPRFIPGLGTSRRPELFVDSGFDRVLIDEADAVATCREVALRYGLLVGGSTGTVLTAVRRLAPTLPLGARIAAISPDLGDKYIDTIYSDDWVADHYPAPAAIRAG